MISDRSKLLSDIWAGTNLVLKSRDDLAFWPEIQALEQCQQDLEWHAEGNVLIHTDMVLSECLAIEPELNPRQQKILRMSCLLHDIEKPKVTTFNTTINHVIAPGHERMGGVSSRYLLREMFISNQDRRLVSELVSTHHLVKRNVQNIDAPGGACMIDRLAARVDTKLLWALELADMRGRESIGKDEQIEIVQLFKMLCEERDIFGKPPVPWIHPNDIVKIPFANVEAANYALKEAHRRRLLGTIGDPYHSLAFIHDQAKHQPADIIVTVGVAGSGKSTAIENLSPEYERISTDGERKERYGSESILGDHGTIFQACAEKLRVVLRRGGKAVYDATNVVPDLRSKIVTLCHDYGAHVTLWVFDISKEELKRRNKQRDRQVPEEIIEKQCAKFEWPLPEEAHEMKVFDETY